ncbi:MAG: hypothetical protein ACJA2Q_001955 [Pseudohongiellaceae bacterium]|jgi:hypothetical protein
MTLVRVIYLPSLYWVAEIVLALLLGQNNGLLSNEGTRSQNVKEKGVRAVYRCAIL